MLSRKMNGEVLVSWSLLMALVIHVEKCCEHFMHETVAQQMHAVDRKRPRCKGGRDRAGARLPLGGGLPLPPFRL